MHFRGLKACPLNGFRGSETRMNASFCWVGTSYFTVTSTVEERELLLAREMGSVCERQLQRISRQQ
jgi:hypothetical protein